MISQAAQSALGYPEHISGTRGASHVLPAAPLSSGGDSQQVTIATASNVSSGLTSSRVMVSCTQPCFARQGSAPTAVNTGADRYLLASIPYFFVITAGNQVAFIKPSGGSDGVAYVTPIPT